MRNYDRDSAAYGRSIRDLLRGNPQAFYSGAIEILKSADDSRGARYLASVLADGNLLLPAISDLTLSKAEAVVLARTAVQAGVLADVLLAQHVMDLAPSLENSVCPAEVQRMLDVLCEISDWSRVLPCLRSLVRQKNPYLQSKAVLMIGRINRNVRWVQNRLAEPDPRVRANAVEALWGIDTEEVRKLLRSACHDSNNRVAGNALLGLYRLGDNSVIPELIKMADSESRRFRASAAWIMGATRDPRFTKPLGRMVGEPNRVVRTRAFAALGQIRAATTQERLAGELRVIARFPRSRLSGPRELHLDVTSKDGREPVKVLPTQLILIEDGQEVVQYSVEERSLPSPLAIAMVFPRGTAVATGCQRGALNALTWKQPSDLWSVVCYLASARLEARAHPAGENLDVPAPQPSLLESASLHFTSNAEVAAVAVESTAPSMDCADLWCAIRRAALGEGWPRRVKRHVVVYSQSDGALPADYAELVAAAKAAHASVHAVSAIANANLESLCQATQGSFQTVASDEETAGAIEQICLSLLARYAVHYQPGADARNLQIVIHTANGWGETSLPVGAL